MFEYYVTYIYKNRIRTRDGKIVNKRGMGWNNLRTHKIKNNSDVMKIQKKIEKISNADSVLLLSYKKIRKVPLLDRIKYRIKDNSFTDYAANLIYEDMIDEELIKEELLNKE